MNAGYEPVKVVSWRKALLLWFQDKVDVLEFHAAVVRSPSQAFQLPSVLRLRNFMRPMGLRPSRLSRHNVFLRDRHQCQYCHNKFSEKKLTIDHVVPLSKGGKHDWSNVVTACSACNNKKADRTPEQAKMKLLKSPERPSWLPQPELGVHDGRLPATWLPWVLEQ